TERDQYQPHPRDHRIPTERHVLGNIIKKAPPGTMGTPMHSLEESSLGRDRAEQGMRSLDRGALTFIVRTRELLKEGFGWCSTTMTDSMVKVEIR
ncbi:hypothetical protein V2J09_009352, partial [Rumex salicifolius]